MRVTSELLVVARAACELCLKDTCMDERDDCERLGADLQSIALALAAVALAVITIATAAVAAQQQRLGLLPTYLPTYLVQVRYLAT